MQVLNLQQFSQVEEELERQHSSDAGRVPESLSNMERFVASY
jgi:hypothetical protein